MNKKSKLNITYVEDLVTLSKLMQKYPIYTKVAQHVIESRKRIEKILKGEDRRLLVIIGPCSIHDINATIDYVRRLKIIRDKYFTYLEIVMRTYFEKPRTSIGWKGFIYDPDLNGSYHVNRGLVLARKLLLQINEIGMPTATEFLDTIIGQFISDLISWGSIGARTSESQIHREMASALSCPIGFKNSTDGNVRIAVEAIYTSRASHIFLSLNKHGQIVIYKTSGNPFGHIIMRGGKKPNYHANDIALACKILREFDFPERLIVDFSHGNCQKQHLRQLDVCNNICQQIINGSNAISGIMAESFLKAGTQKVNIGKSIVHGQSITDPCLSWEESESMLEQLANAVASRF